MKFPKLLKTEPKYQLFIYGLVVLGILFYPMGFVHEAGHYIIGHSLGSSCKLNIDWILSVNCNPAPKPVELYFVMGGIAGTIVSLSLFLFKPVRVKKYLFMGVCGIALDHFLKAIFETVVHSVYLHNFLFNIVMGSLPILLIFILAIYYTGSDEIKSQYSNSG